MKLVIPLHVISRQKNPNFEWNRKCILPSKIGAVTSLIIFGKMHFLLLSENDFFHEIECVEITSFMDFLNMWSWYVKFECENMWNNNSGVAWILMINCTIGVLSELWMCSTFLGILRLNMIIYYISWSGVPLGILLSWIPWNLTLRHILRHENLLFWYLREVDFTKYD